MELSRFIWGYKPAKSKAHGNDRRYKTKWVKLS